MEIYIDGSSIIGPDGERYGGAGIYFGCNDKRNSSIPVKGDNVTNNLAELMALHYALRLTRGIQDITIYSDSEYCIKSVTVWCHEWQANGWMTTKRKPVSNAETIRNCMDMISQREAQGKSLTLHHVMGHSGNIGNNEADKLARAGAIASQDEAMKNTHFFSDDMLSQWEPSWITEKQEDGSIITYNCAEQYMMHKKALILQDADTARKIMEVMHPRDQKWLGRMIQSPLMHEWNRLKVRVVTRGNMLKFSQNEAAREYLMATGSKRIVEARPDTIWGIGITVAQAQSGIAWRGENLLGKILMDVRERLRTGN